MSGEEEVIEVTIDMAELKKMKVPELKRKVAELGLPTKGTKAELLARVEKYLHEQDEEELLEDVEEGEGDDGIEAEEVESDALPEDTTSAVTPVVQEPIPVGAKETKVADGEENNSIAVATKLENKTITNVQNIRTNSQADRLAQRSARFGENTSEEAKKIARAERFGTTLENGYKGLGKRLPPSEEELEKMRKRAERFGTSVSPAITAVEEDERKKKRLERFEQSTIDLSDKERMKSRAARFGAS